MLGRSFIAGVTAGLTVSFAAIQSNVQARRICRDDQTAVIPFVTSDFGGTRRAGQGTRRSGTTGNDPFGAPSEEGAFIQQYQQCRST
jgi:hypothetical protein